MNIYKILLFDGYATREVLIQGLDIIQALQANTMFMLQQIVRVELVGTANTQEDYTNKP